MEKKETKNEKKKIALVLILLLALAGYAEKSGRLIGRNGTLERNAAGEGEMEAELRLDAEDVLKDYPYSITLEEEKPTKEEAGEYFQQAKEEIDETFCRDGETISHVTEAVNLKESYAGGVVQAAWNFDDYTAIQTDGILAEEELPEDGILINAEAELVCGDYREVYAFSFRAYPKELTKAEEILAEVEKALDEQQKKAGVRQLTLPEEVSGVKLSWSEKKEHMAGKMLLLEILVLAMIPVIKREQRRQEEKKRRESFLLDYPDIVSKITVLMGSGMSLKQSWNQISARYSEKRQKNNIQIHDAYEEMVKTNREIQDGESERLAYQKFGERVGIYAYYRFVRILIQNLQKGTRGLCELLKQESETAFEERKLLAKKMGEEAGTKMLIPLILMMAIVMAIVIMPAIINFMK